MQIMKINNLFLHLPLSIRSSLHSPEENFMGPPLEAWDATISSELAMVDSDGSPFYLQMAKCNAVPLPG